MNKNLKTKLTLLLLLAISLFTVYSCKKNENEITLTDLQLIANAKSWYEAQQKNKISKISIAGRESELILTPNWETAKVARIDGIASVAAEIETNIPSMFKTEKYYALVVKNDGDELAYRIIDISGKENFKDKDGLDATQLYKSAFASKDLIALNQKNVAVLNSGAKIQVAVLKDEKPVVLSSSQIPSLKMENQNCYDAYMVTRVYDQNGVLIDIYQEYMGFQICTEAGMAPTDDGGVGGGGTGGNPSQNGPFMTIEVTDADGVYEGEASVSTVDSVSYREWIAVWHFANIKYRDNIEVGVDYNFQGQATELLKTKFVNGVWEWVSCVNASVNTSGLKPSYVNIVKDAHAVTFINDANVQLAYHVHAATGSYSQHSTVRTKYRAFQKK